MGRSYWFECSRCGYRAKVSGRADRGLNFFVQTIVCRDCKELHDAVVRARLPEEPPAAPDFSTPRRAGPATLPSSKRKAPSFQSVAGRLLYTGLKRLKWRSFDLQCPVSPLHRVEQWNDPDKCPRCGVYLEKNVLPYRLWD